MTHLFDLSRSTKRGIYLAADTALIPIALYIACALRYGTALPLSQIAGLWPLFPVVTVLGVGVLIALRLPWIKMNAFEDRAMLRIAAAGAGLSLLAIATGYLLSLPAPRSVPLIFGMMFFLASVMTRVLGLQILSRLTGHGANRQPVLVYGAGAAGIQLASALRRAHEARPVCFVDDNPNLHGLMVAGLPVHSPARLPALVGRHGIERVLLAMPSIGKERQQRIIDTLRDLPVDVQILPSYIDMMSGRSLTEALQPVSPDALLGRDKVGLDTPEIAKAYAGRTIMVTGAGGSIGSELCRQLLDCNPARLVLFEQSEFALYSIDRDARHLARDSNIGITTRLGSVTDRRRVDQVIAEEKVEIILHAAAYKHVPLVEENELEGARNNVLGTHVVAEAAIAAKCERFILVSTDKAVRPTNIMGATKRMAELVVQDLQTRTELTKFAMVRFGNVLGSSGSVLPLFQKQIEAGGPLTVTHPKVTRFFMTIPEAARLVLLAGAYAQGGDVFVLDMGKPQKIVDIARRMIELSGRKLHDPEAGEEGDIAIEFTGLRPGEKLYEELLIDDASLRATPHPKILRAEEATLSQIEMAATLRELRATLEERDSARLRKLIAARVDGYHRQEETATAI